MISRIINKLINRYKLHILINELLDKEKVNQCEVNVINRGGVFYPEARVENLKKDPHLITIGSNTHIRGELLIWRHAGSIAIGSNCYLGSNSKIWSGSETGVRIGNNVLISHNVSIIDSDSHELDHVERAKGFDYLTKYGHPEKNTSVKAAPIIIEDDVWISYNVCILKGITIGKGSILGAGSVVTKDIPEFSLVAGNPGVVIKTLDII